MKTLAQLGEFPFIDAISRIVDDKRRRARSVKVGIGDDAACLQLGDEALVTVDSLIEGVHFRRGWLSPAALGRRAFRVAASDIAACGGDARFVLLSVGAPPTYPADQALALVRGLVRDAEASGAALVGGNVSRAPVLSLTVTVIGEVRARMLRRDGAQVGDWVYVTGPVGGASAGIVLLGRGERDGVLQRAYREPPLRLAVASSLAAERGVGAMIDVSDGLVQDLAHLCAASRVSSLLDVGAVPMPRALAARCRRKGRASVLGRDPLRHALHGGDDYELLFTARPGPRERSRIEAVCSGATGCDAHLVGTIVARRQHWVYSAGDCEPLSGGFSHFSKRRS